MREGDLEMVIDLLGHTAEGGRGRLWAGIQSDTPSPVFRAVLSCELEHIPWLLRSSAFSVVKWG